MQTRAMVLGMAAALLLGGCAGSDGLFRNQEERLEAARLLLQQQAGKESALREIEEARLQAQREAEEDRERARRHRVQREEAEHQRALREVYQGDEALPPPARPPRRYNPRLLVTARHWTVCPALILGSGSLAPWWRQES